MQARVPALDGLRGIAILGVLAVHLHMLLDLSSPAARAADTFLAVGAWGVDLFFVLSGYLITGILLETVDSPSFFKTFYARRFLRLFPVYYGYLFLVWAVLPLVHRWLQLDMAYKGPWWWYWLYLANWKPGAGDLYVGHFWSLAIEEQFYLVWPAFVRFLPRRWLAPACGLAVVSALVLRCKLVSMGASMVWIHNGTPARMDTLAWGALLAIGSRNARAAALIAKWSTPVGIAAAACFAALAVRCGSTAFNSIPIATFGSALAPIAFVALVARVAAADPGIVHGALTSRPLVLFGSYSYCIYVVHVAIYTDLAAGFQALPKRGLLVGLLFAALMISASFVVGSLSWRWFEKPILRMKERFQYAEMRSAAEV